MTSTAGETAPRAMRFSVCVDPGRPWDELVSLVDLVERTGWDGVYVCDHFMPYRPDGKAAVGSMLEGWTTLAALAGRTRHVRLGNLVLGNTYRHPAVVANMAATMSRITGGRFVLGLGAGWQANEHSAYGIELPPVARRLDQFGEACRIIRSLLESDRTTYRGDFYRLVDATCEPKPAPHGLPILVGGGGERRTLRIAAEVADEWHVWRPAGDFAHKSRVLDDHCGKVGRDPATIQRSSGASVCITRSPAELANWQALDADIVGGSSEMVGELVAEYRSAGADEFIARDVAGIPLERMAETLSAFASDLFARFGRDGRPPSASPGVPAPE